MSFALFGEREWAARLVPLLFSLGSIFLLYRLAEKVYSREVALVAAAFFSFLPLETLYGAHVDPQGPPVTFFGLLLLLAYEERRFLLGAAALVLGAAFDWPIHYLAFLIAVHAWFFRGEMKGLKKWSAGLLAGSLFLLAGFLLYARFVAPNSQNQYLKATPVDSFLFWTGVRVPPDRIPGRPIEAPGVPSWLLQMGNTFRGLFTIPLLSLAVLGAGVAWSRRGPAALSILLLWGVAHIVLFPLGAFVHDYWSLYLGPGVALAAASGLVSIANALGRRRRPFLIGAATAFSAFLLISGIRRVEALPKEEVVLGRKLNELTKPEEGVLLLNPIDARDAYYADRAILDRVNRLSLFEEALRGGVPYRYFVVPQQPYRERSEKPLFQVLDDCCRAYMLDDYYLFDLEPLSRVAPDSAIP